MDKVEEKTIGLVLQNHASKQPPAVFPEQENFVNVAADNSNNATTRTEWGEIDTTAPFESVKAAVTLFGEGVFGDKADGKRLKLPVGERRISKDTELHQVQKELNKSKEQLKCAEATKAQALFELEETKKVVKDLTEKLEKAHESKNKAREATEIARLRVEELEPANTNTSHDNDTSLQGEVYAAREKHITTVAELDAAKQESRSLKQELAASLEAKELAAKQSEEALIAAETNSKRMDELLKEISVSNESLVLVKLAFMEAEKERVNILAEKAIESQKAAVAVEKTSKQLEALRKELDAAKDMERKLTTTVAAVENLQKEIVLAKESQSKIAKAASKAHDKLNKVKLEIEEIKNASPFGSSSVESLSLELREAKENMHQALQEELALRVSMDSLSTELEQVRKELAETKQKVVDAESTAADLNTELHKCRSTLVVAVAVETKAKDAVSDLSLALQQLTAETETARKEAEGMKEEAEKAKLEADQAKAALSTAESRFKAAWKEADAAKAAEEIALGRIKALSEKTIAARASTSESSAGITISQDEYNSLTRKITEADELANMKVAAAIAQVEAIKTAEKELLMKLEVANREIEETKSASEQALRKAEMAEAAKRAVEGELRRWREREQRKRAALLEAAQDFTNNGKNNISRTFTEGKSVHSQPLGKVLNIKIASPEKVDHDHSIGRSFTMKKKKQLIPNIGGMFTKKKNQVDGDSLQ